MPVRQECQLDFGSSPAVTFEMDDESIRAMEGTGLHAEGVT